MLEVDFLSVGANDLRQSFLTWDILHFYELETLEIRPITNFKLNTLYFKVSKITPDVN